MTTPKDTDVPMFLSQKKTTAPDEIADIILVAIVAMVYLFICAQATQFSFWGTLGLALLLSPFLALAVPLIAAILLPISLLIRNRLNAKH